MSNRPPPLVLTAHDLRHHYMTAGWSFTAGQSLSSFPSLGTVHELSQHKEQHSQRCLKLYSLYDHLVLTPGAVILTPHAKILGESVFYDHISLQPERFRDIHLDRSERLTGSYVPLHGVWHNEFWHWVLEYLPRVILAESVTTEFLILLAPDSPAFCREALALLGIAPERIIVPKHGALWLEEVLLPERLCASAELLDFPSVAEALRERVIASLSTSSAEKTRVFVTRRIAPSERRLINEHEVETLLAAYDFTTVTLEELSFREQCELAANAEAWVGPHGAGMVHSLFMPPRSLVVEFFSPHFVHPNCPFANKLLQHRYFPLSGAPRTPAPANPLAARAENIHVECKKLSEILQEELGR